MKRKLQIVGAGLAAAAVAAALALSSGPSTGHSQAQDFHFKGQAALNFTKAPSLNFT